ncbi:MAG: alpha-amylase/4-alpha-glucanotransferase domain-containing protein [Elusimicrobiota bacterium]
MNNPTPNLDFIFGLHFHQPVGNFDSVLENAYQDAYLPLIKEFKKHNKIKMNLHISSPLLDFFNQRHPDFIQDIKEEVKKNRIEILGGGIYEPIITAIPEHDLIGQIKREDEKIKQLFETETRGIWLTERVWEPHIPSLLKNTSKEYLGVDDTHFFQAGFVPEQLKGYYITEDMGNTLGVFIINKEMRYFIPFKPVDDIIEKLKNYAQTSPSALICMLDDGEKFGVWPNTKEWVHDKNWLKDFFARLEENSDWLKTHTLSQYYDNNPPIGKAYLPTSSYYEMLEWTMPVDGANRIDEIKNKLKEKDIFEQVDPYITGGIWKNYFHKYPESNYMHKKMLYLSSMLKENENKFNDKNTFEKAKTYLYRSQCNCAYWHGVFGGIYLSHLREAIYNNLNKLHSIIDRTIHQNKEFIQTINYDLNRDKFQEILVNTDKLFVAINTKNGGIIEEISDKINSINYLNTLSRTKEYYHKKILKQSEDNNDSNQNNGVKSIHDIEKNKNEKFIPFLVYDNYHRKNLVDHLFPENFSFDDFKNNSYKNSNTFDLKYSYELDTSDQRTNIKLYKETEYAGTKIKIIKNLSFYPGERKFQINLKIKNLSEELLNFKFGLEFNFSMLSEQSEGRYYFFNKEKDKIIKSLSDEGLQQDISGFGVLDKDRNFELEINSDQNTNIVYCPVRAVTSSEGGFELTYLSSCTIPIFDIKLDPERTFSTNLIYKIKNI